MTEKSFNFEKAMARIEEINEILSSPGTPLQEGIKLYEEGAKLAQLCKKALDDAKKKIDEVSGVE